MFFYYHVYNYKFTFTLLTSSHLRLFADSPVISERLAGLAVVDFVRCYFVVLGFRRQAIRDRCPILAVNFGV